MQHPNQVSHASNRPPSAARPGERLSAWLNAPVSIAPLVGLRMAFGLLMLISTIRFVALGWVDAHFIEPAMHFKYFGFHWVQPLGATAMYAMHALMILACVGITLGAYYRVSSLLFALLFTYGELIDLTYYLNHYYFISVFSFLMACLPAHRAFSVDVWRHPAKARPQVPHWVLLICYLQIGIVYTYAGLAKINSEWLLRAMPLKIWLPAHQDLPLIGWAMRYELTAYLFSWFGMLYDSLIVWFLLWRRTRAWAYLAVIGFHLMTGILFQIGMFPYVMMALTWVFFSPSFHERVMAGLRQAWAWVNPAQAQSSPPRSRAPVSVYRLPRWARQPVAWGLGLFVLFQLLFPWRYLLYEGNLFWHEEGYRFSWRVMLMEKAGTATFYVKHPETGREGLVAPGDFLNAHQEKQMAMQPDMILQFAHFLAKEYQVPGQPLPAVRAEVYVTLNGHPSRLLIDPAVNLTQVQDGWQAKDWVLPWANKDRPPAP
jgi:hypothetical protein